jgi:hypothetical protein
VKRRQKQILKQGIKKLRVRERERDKKREREKGAKRQSDKY